MDMTGEHRIPAPRQRVWEALNDPEVLQKCITGCESVEKVSDTEFTAKVTAKVGPVKAKFTGKVTLSDVDPPNGYTITGEGTGGVAGFGKGGAKVSLTDDEGGGTVLTYTAHASVGGKLAQIGSRLVDATARKMADEFFTCFVETVGTGETAATPASAPATTPAPAMAAETFVTGAAAPAADTPPEAHRRTATVVDPVVSREAPGATAQRSQESAGQMGEAAHLSAAATPRTVAESPSPPADASSGGLSPKIWIPALVVLVILLLWAFS